MKKSIVAVVLVLAMLVLASCEGKEKSAEGGSCCGGSSHESHEMHHAAAAEGQETIVCPVMDMEVAKADAIVFTHEGLEFAVCCGGCINAIKENFEEYKEHGTPVE